MTNEVHCILHCGFLATPEALSFNLIFPTSKLLLTVIHLATRVRYKDPQSRGTLFRVFNLGRLILSSEKIGSRAHLFDKNQGIVFETIHYISS